MAYSELFSWLKKLAWDVHELVESTDGTAMATFRSMVIKWDAITDHDLTLPLSEPSYVEPVSTHERSIVEQYTVLAAIHDRCCNGVASINQWEKGMPECIRAAAFAGLVHDIPALIHDGDERILNVFLHRVKDDLANSCSAIAEQQKAANSKNSANGNEKGANAKPEKDGTKQQKTGDERQFMPLKRFIEIHCDLSGKPDIQSKVELLHEYNRKQKIALPKPAHKYKKGQHKFYYVDDLKSKWPTYQKNMPTLPSLKLPEK